jgi:SAM-dependent methyltransferase
MKRVHSIISDAAQMPSRALGWIARLAGMAPAVPQASDPLDTYAAGAPDPQQTIDIFKGGWSSRFPAETGLSAGSADLFADPRLRALLDRIDLTGARVLELGPLEGAHSHMLQAAGAASVLAIDALVYSYLKCLIVKDLLRLDRVTFQFGDFMPFLGDGDEVFDLIVASGVLYHQRDPIEFIRRLALRGDRVFVWTHYYDEGMRDGAIPRAAFRKTRSQEVDGFSCDLFRLDYDAYLKDGKYRGGVDDHTHWMAKADLLACLAHFGLGDVEILEEQTDHPYGPNVTLVARRSPARGATILERRQQRLEQEMRDTAGPEPWCVDAARTDGDSVELSGWAIPPGGDPARAGLRVNGREAGSVTMGIDRPDVGFHYWFYPRADRSGFSARVPAGDASTVTLEYIDRQTGAPLDPWHGFHVRLGDLDGRVPVPPMPLIARAHAGNTQNQYLVEGYSNFVKLEQALKRTTGKVFGDFETILDFGCGCGRVTRHLAARGRGRTVGVDIDGEAIEWCRASLPGDFHAIAPQPPLPLADGSVDLVVAIDVFIHFREADGLRWIEELARVSRPGGILLISIASSRALARARLGADHYAAVGRSDFIDLSRNDDLDAVLADREYYRNVFHSHRYVRREWTRAGLTVLDIVPGLIGNHNDVVVLQRAG